jgi:hypothetical protein
MICKIIYFKVSLDVSSFISDIIRKQKLKQNGFINEKI